LKLKEQEGEISNSHSEIPASAGAKTPENPAENGTGNGADPVPSSGGFAEFWAVYPLHVGNRAALLAYATACNRAPHAVIIEGARRYALTREGQEPRYTIAPAKWLEGDHWNDEPPKRQTEAEKAAKRRALAAQIDRDLERK
jgi:hypothetical protein